MSWRSARPPFAGLTRTEAAVRAHLQAAVATDPGAPRWHGVLDHLSTDCAAALVRWVAQGSALARDLSVKGTTGILHTRTRRATFLRDPAHPIVFHYTPRQCSWLNQIEIWRSLLRTMAKPFMWTYQAKPRCDEPARYFRYTVLGAR